MTEQEILSKAIEKAIARGWDVNEFCGFASDFNLQRPVDQVFAEIMQYDYKNEERTTIVDSFRLPSLIFDRKFARALWGDGWAWFTKGQSGDTLTSGNYINYKGHLANMVVVANPIKYLGKNI